MKEETLYGNKKLINICISLKDIYKKLRKKEYSYEKKGTIIYSSFFS
jgi:hypothetical protein